MSASRAPDAARCPICDEPNRCALAADPLAENCWCVSARIPAEALARIPAEAKNRACLCARCAEGRSDPS